MKTRFLLVAAVFLTACSTRYVMHDIPNATESDIGLVYDPRAYLTIYSIDGKATDYTMGKVVELSPGEHRFILTWNSGFRPPTLLTAPLFKPESGDPYADITFDVQQGYSYTLQAKSEGKPIYKGNADEACIYGEPSDAPGSSVNVTGEYRMHSENVMEIACGEINR